MADDGSAHAELKDELELLRRRLDATERTWLFTDIMHQHGALMTVRSGAGGQEAEHWCQRLMRMYEVWAQRSGVSLTWEDVDATAAGARSGTARVNGRLAFGQLSSEHGAHRLSRVSDFDPRGRRHTSFCSVEVLPLLPERAPLQISDADVRVETFRGSGPGGQHRNKTDSAVRATHVPTGIVATCQRGRSQHQNREAALGVLAVRVAAHHAAQDVSLSSAPAAAFGQRIRSYVLNPSQLVADHRTGVKVGAAVRMLETGAGLDEMMRAVALRRRSEQMSANEVTVT